MSAADLLPPPYMFDIYEHANGERREIIRVLWTTENDKLFPFVFFKEGGVRICATPGTWERWAKKASLVFRDPRVLEAIELIKSGKSP